MIKRLIASIIYFTFSLSNLQNSYAQDFNVNQLPVPGTMVGESASFAPLSLKGLIVNPQKPLEFQFIVDTGKGPLDTASIKEEAKQLVKYFLAGLTIPEGDLWVNLSPYEKNRMVPEALGQTDLGRDLLAQDYILKQLTASLIYPEKDLGKAFWSRVYAKAQQQFGTTNVPVNTFNKVWILPDQAQVYENGSAAYVTKSTLKVMLDEDYLALQKYSIIRNGTDSIGANIVRQIILPEITKEVNTGKNFAPLRQIYQSLILAKWYKQTIQNALLETLYTNKNRVAGVNLNDPTIKEQIYNRYLQAYKKGTFNYIKEDSTPNGQVGPRKYFSGGFTEMGMKIARTQNPLLIGKSDGAMKVITIALHSFEGRSVSRRPDTAMVNVNNGGEPKVHLPEGLVNAADVTVLFPKSRKILHPDEGGIFKYILGDRNPFVVDLKRSKGDHVATIDRDKSGRPYYFINFNEYAIRVLGYNRPELREAMKRHIFETTNRTTYSDFITSAYADYVKMMMSIHPKGLDHIFIANTGAEANENAFKALKLKRPKSQFLIAFDGAYHGRTPGALSVTSKTAARKGLFKFPWSWISFPSTNRLENSESLDKREVDSLAGAWTLMVRGKTRTKGETLVTVEEEPFRKVIQQLDHLIEKYNNHQLNALEVAKGIEELKGKLPPDIFKESENVTGFIAEPYQGEGGMKFVSPRFFQRLRCLTALFDVPFIFDEVQSGFFVTGTAWAHEDFDLPIPPDIVTFSKKAQMGGMYINDRYYVNETGKLDSTWGGSDSGIIRAVTFEEIIRKERLDLRVKELGAYALEKLRAIEARYPALNLNTRGWGLVLALDFPNEKFRDQVVEAAWRRGLIVNLAGIQTIRILPCFDTKTTTIDEAFQILEEAIKDIVEKNSEQAPNKTENLAKPNAAMLNENGGIDLNQINVLRNGKKINVHFDPAQLNVLEQGGFEGFTPVIINIQRISNPFQLLGIKLPAKQVMQLGLLGPQAGHSQ